MTHPWSDLDATLSAVWDRLSAAPDDRKSPLRLPVLATAGTGGGAEARTVVLRAADRSSARLAVYTDADSGKVAQIAADDRGTLLFWDPGAQLQIRVRASFAARPGTAEEWRIMSDDGRRAYGGQPPPGHVIAAPEVHSPVQDVEKFIVLDSQVIEIETLILTRLRHYRARFAQVDGFRGQWLAP